MGSYIDADGLYYEGDQRGTDMEVPRRPDLSYRWDDNAGEWVMDQRQAAIHAIAALEREQQTRLTARAQRELYLGIFAALSMTAHPAFAQLKALDDAIKAERTKL